MRATPEWLAWLQVFAEYCGLSDADLIQQAVQRMVDSSGYLPGPPIRIKRRRQRDPVWYAARAEARAKRAAVVEAAATAEASFQAGRTGLPHGNVD